MDKRDLKKMTALSNSMSRNLPLIRQIVLTEPKVYENFVVATSSLEHYLNVQNMRQRQLNAFMARHKAAEKRWREAETKAKVKAKRDAKRAVAKAKAGANAKAAPKAKGAGKGHGAPLPLPAPANNAVPIADA